MNFYIRGHFVGTGIDDYYSGTTVSRDVFTVNSLEDTMSSSRAEGRLTLKTDYISPG